MASEAILEHLISNPGRAYLQTPLVLRTYACMHTCTSDIHVTPFWNTGLYLVEPYISPLRESTHQGGLTYVQTVNHNYT